MKNSEAVIGLLGKECMDRLTMSVTGKERERGVYAMCSPCLPWVITPLHRIRNGPFLLLQPCLPRAAGQNCMMGRALDWALPAPTWYLHPQPPGPQVPSSPSAKFPGVADKFLKGWVSMGLP